ncbi:hypothetical protein CRE_08591 [Caenorhabditis remanei]|uniref:Protein kinase domain-containing protein n=1 Tax=Caenorhabditis remanei TaxID=31234 RepID=E3NIJ1_CAERE|nr:hypothetical protein CRE_08591 [Caenorhabditis remanei]
MTCTTSSHRNDLFYVAKSTEAFEKHLIRICELSRLRRHSRIFVSSIMASRSSSASSTGTVRSLSPGKEAKEHSQCNQSNETVDVVDHLENLNVYHLDLKTANIYFTEKEAAHTLSDSIIRSYPGDFGVCRFHEVNGAATKPRI